MTVIPLFAPGPWQMSRGERAALEGTLAALRPTLAIEIGTAQGGALERIAAYSAEVHSFDVVPPELDVPEHVTLHTGDSHALLPAFLAALAEQGRRPDFALVDGDHSAQGVRRDVEDLLASPAVTRTVIVLHDTVNEEVRAGLDAVRWPPKASYVDLDWVPGHLWAEPYLRHELWGGLGLVLVDPEQPGPVHEAQYFATAPLLAAARDRVVAAERPSPALARGRRWARRRWARRGGGAAVTDIRHDANELDERLAEVQSEGTLSHNELLASLTDEQTIRGR